MFLPPDAVHVSFVSAAVVVRNVMVCTMEASGETVSGVNETGIVCKEYVYGIVCIV